MSEYMFGVREDGSTVSIFDIPIEEAGLKCRCKCPKCNRDFQACSLQGKVQRYFRHNTEEYDSSGISSLNGCSATTANETGLHLMAKEIIAETKTIAFPAMIVPRVQWHLNFSEELLEKIPEAHTLRHASVFHCNEVVVEERTHQGIRPDVSVSSDEGTFLIEIMVTHRVDRDKREKVTALGLPMLEIDLSSYVEEGISRDALQKVITERLENKKWLCYPKDLFDRTRNVLNHTLQGLKEKRERLEAQRRELFSSQTYASILKRNRNNELFDQYARDELHYNASHDNFPFFIDIPITGEILFDCDRRIWQGKIFDRWIYNRNSDSIYLLSLWDSLVKDHHIPYNSVLRDHVVLPGDRARVYLPYRVIHKYFKYLEELGFVKIEGPWATVVRKHDLVPPNQEYTEILQSVLARATPVFLNIPETADYQISTMLRAERKRREEERQEAARIAAEEAQRKAEEEQRRVAAAKRAQAEAEQREREKALEDAVRTANYEQNNYPIYIGGRRWMLCRVCNTPKDTRTVRMLINPAYINKGICAECKNRLEQEQTAAEN